MLYIESMGSLALFVLAVPTLLIINVLGRVLYNLYWHPLRRFPGPRLWAASRLPFLWSLVRGRVVHDVAAMHRAYGGMVRVAPDELSCATPEASGDVLQPRAGHAPFLRDRRWWGRPPGLPDSLLSVHWPEDHRRMRRLFAPAFAESALAEQEPILQRHAGRLVQQLRGVVRAGSAADGEKGEPTAAVDVVRWFNFTTFDIFGDLGFGEPFECLRDARYHPWIALLFGSVQATAFIIATRFLPPLGAVLQACLPRTLVRKKEQHFQQIVDKVDRRLGWEAQRPDIMAHVIQTTDRGRRGMSMDQIYANFMFMTTTGSETPATVLSGTANYLAVSPEALGRLTAEVRGAFGSEDQMTIARLRDLPYLEAVIREGMRLCPSVPIILPRVVPEAGDRVGGVWVPGNTSISLHNWALFRDPDRFHDAGSFRPERWLASPRTESCLAAFADDELAAVQPFGLGPRSCLGQHLAWAEMRLILTRLVWAFDLEAVEAPLRWEELRTYLLVEKRPMEVRLRERKDLHEAN